jgi:hypothetical protein
MSINIKIGADISSVDTAIHSVSKSLNGLKTPVKNANFALNSLSQVTRDLPFGFIAIQNNLPLVVDSFGQLSREAGGTVPALKALGQSLIGPAGIGLAFSAVTSIITVAVQEYGSLGNAIDALFSKNSDLAKSQNLFNKELAEASGNTQAEATKIDILVKNLNDLSKPLADRYAAYVELRKISPDIVAGIKEENALTQASIGIINANAQARKELLLLKAKEAAISAVINKNATEQFALEIQIQQNVKDLLTAQNDYNNAKKQSSVLAKTAQQGISAESITLKNATKEYINNVNAYNRLASVQQTFADQLDPIVSKIANIDAATKVLNNSTKDLSNSTKNQTREFTATQVAAAALLDILKQTSDIIRGQKIQLDSKAFEQISNKNLNLTPTVDFSKVVDINQVSGIKIVTQKLAENTQKALDVVNKNTEESFRRTADIINGVLFQPLEGLFTNLIETGKFAFKDFVNAILQQLTRLIAKLTAAAAVAGILAILTGGGSAAGGAAAGGASSFGTIFKSLSGLGGGIANPGFGGVNPGGMAMAGSVNLVLRGQDLVGSINRTNSQLSRIG